MRILVKTGSKDLKFRVQRVLQDSETYRPVTLDHNVQAKLNDGTLIKKPAPAKKEAKK